MNNPYGIRRVLFANSVEKKSATKAFAEWELYVGSDAVGGAGHCGLCNQRLDYVFSVQNRHNDKVLLVGRDCIFKFGIKVYEYNKLLTTKEAHDRLNELVSQSIRAKKVDHVLEAIGALQEQDGDFPADSFKKYYADRRAFTPNQLSFLLWQFKVHNIVFEPRFFKLTITRNREKSQLLDMPDWKLRQLWNCMTPAQKSWLERRSNEEA